MIEAKNNFIFFFSKIKKEKIFETSKGKKPDEENLKRKNKMKIEITNRNHKATITHLQDGYGEMTYRVFVLCMTGTHINGDVLFLKNYATEKNAINAANRFLKKVA